MSTDNEVPARKDMKMLPSKVAPQHNLSSYSPHIHAVSKEACSSREKQKLSHSLSLQTAVMLYFRYRIAEAFIPTSHQPFQTASHAQCRAEKWAEILLTKASVKGSAGRKATSLIQLRPRSIVNFKMSNG